MKQRGRPFQKGQSGNPGGRPRVAADIRELARALAPSAIEELARLALKAKSESARISAIRELLDRGLGRPMQTHQIDDAKSSPFHPFPPDVTAAEIRERICADLRELMPSAMASAALRSTPARSWRRTRVLMRREALSSHHPSNRAHVSLQGSSKISSGCCPILGVNPGVDCLKSKNITIFQR
jgi:hypothetical protein